MDEATIEQVRGFRLHAHHLDRAYPAEDALALVGACGMQNSPPGAWETSLANRAPSLGVDGATRLLAQGGGLVQVWSLRGAPYVFPEAEAGAFLSALVPEAGEPWIYTDGIGLALDALGMGFGELLDVQRSVMPQLDGLVVEGKAELDRLVAAWIEPLVPEAKRAAWRAPSMYGSPDVQTVGGAVASFLLRPCAFEGLVAFGERRGQSPTFMSYRSWTGHALEPAPDAAARLVRKFLRCYGPATPAMLAAWLGCSGAQARRMWEQVADEVAPVGVLGKRAFVPVCDLERLMHPEPLERETLLLGPHDPYLDQRDRAVLLADKARQRRVWTTVSNPGAVVHRGAVVGLWKGRKRGGRLAVEAELWEPAPSDAVLRMLAEEHAAFRGLEFAGIKVLRA